LLFDVLVKSRNNKLKMNIDTILTAILVMGIVWGGLTFIFSRAWKYEKMKMKNGEE
jgi:D-alanyl-lipoteichoic acid acyltransferase DltB (MBOAT superfamily)